MPDEKLIYNQDALRYERLIAREDYQANILPALRQVLPLEGLHVVDTGTGTGRLARMLAPLVHTILGLDVSTAMLLVAKENLQKCESTNCSLVVADHRWLPLQESSAELVVSGWSLSYLALWNPDHWEAELAQALGEISRILGPGGTLIILETLGTGVEVPHLPENLKDYFTYLDEHRFASAWIRTDYKFKDQAEAEELAGFFFGEEMPAHTIPLPDSEEVILPECTGLWWRTERV
ncbi:MAG: class I SAM-dependent methyltransferase [Omnitrophica WOR_2 bacterium]